MAAFNVGDKCRGINYTGRYEFRNGMIGTITDGLKERESSTTDSGMVTRDWMYVVTWADGSVRAVSPHFVEHLFTKENADWAKTKLDTMLDQLPSFNDPRQNGGNV